MSEAKTTCPICKNENACGLESGSDTCWCFGVRIAASTLASIPPELQGKACICAACAAKAGDGELSPLRGATLPLARPDPH